MFVAVIHRVHDPDGLRAAVGEGRAADLIEPVTPAFRATSRDLRIVICVWEGESVIAVRDVVERSVGSFADTEYYEVQVT
ncbi:MAG: hypothetical protein JO291_05775 [Acidimicrobiia bacterium]|nr:hypothetical protein [Acidimicrobiia bacterium]